MAKKKNHVRFYFKIQGTCKIGFTLGFLHIMEFEYYTPWKDYKIVGLLKNYII